MISVGSGDEALDTLQDSTLRPALLFTDVVMPGLSGPARFKRLLALAPTTRVLFTSGYADDDLFATGTERDDIHFDAKPFSGEDLRRAVAEPSLRRARARTSS